MRTATTISDSTGVELQLGLLEYRFTGRKHHVSPHKIPRSGKSYIPTTPSTRDAIKEKVTSHKGHSSIFDRDKTQEGFLSPLRGCTFLPYKKHIEDDIIRNLSDMGLNDMKMEVSKDIFGSDKDKEKGIVDSTDEDEFVAKVSSMADKWDGIEQRIHSGKQP